MEENYSKKAAKWWSDTIKRNELRTIHGLDSFEHMLSVQIRNLTSVKASLSISTLCSSNKLLDEIACYSGLDARIPEGYEMRILFNNVFVYNRYGELVANF